MIARLAASGIPIVRRLRAVPFCDRCQIADGCEAARRCVAPDCGMSDRHHASADTATLVEGAPITNENFYPHKDQAA